jgi:hypothetical protein
MAVYERTHRLAPWWLVVILALILGVGTMGVARAGKWDAVAGLPVFAIFWYGWAVAAVNRARVRVDWEGVRTELGPLPVGAVTEGVKAWEVARVYVRHAWMPTKSGSIEYLAAGVERADGRWMDLSAPLGKDEEAWNDAREIARALSWARGVEELWGKPRKMDWKAARPVWIWAGAFLAAIAWAVYVEAALRGA